jgi:hypothetical protein
LAIATHIALVQVIAIHKIKASNFIDEAFDDRPRVCPAAEMKDSVRLFLDAAERLRQQKKLALRCRVQSSVVSQNETCSLSKTQIMFELGMSELALVKISLERSACREQLESTELFFGKCFRLFHQKKRAFLFSVQVKEALKVKCITLSSEISRRKYFD